MMRRYAFVIVLVAAALMGTAGTASVTGKLGATNVSGSPVTITIASAPDTPTALGLYGLAHARDPRRNSPVSVTIG